MCDYAFSEIECKIIKAQIERRAKYRQEFLKLRTDPCKHSQQAGFVAFAGSYETSTCTVPKSGSHEEDPARNFMDKYKITSKEIHDTTYPVFLEGNIKDGAFHIKRTTKEKFDVAHQRFMSLKACQAELFVPTPALALNAIFMVVLPMCTYGYLIYNQRSKRENEIRTGQLRYRDRIFKLA